MENKLERLSDTMKLSAHVTRILGQNPGMMTLQGTNCYLLQPPSNPLAPIILIDTSSPHTAQQYVDLVMLHLQHLGLQSGTRETHFESPFSKASLDNFPPEKHEELKAKVIGERLEAPHGPDDQLTEYGGTTQTGQWAPNATKARRLPPIEHIILTHRHLDHVGALPTLLKTLQEHELPPPKLWKLPSPDEAELQLSERDRPTTDAAIWQTLPQGTYQSFSPFQPMHPIMPGLMISILDPVYKHLLKHDKDGKPKWNDVPEVARVSLRCLRTPGHTADSVSLVMCEGEKGVFTGDTVLGEGTTVFTDLASYMVSLKTLLAIKPSTMYPAHGPHIVGQEDCTTHLSNYISHRMEREGQIVQLLQYIASDPANVRTLVDTLMQGFEAEKAAETKFNHEFLSGKPFVPKKKKPDDAKDEETQEPDPPTAGSKFPSDERALPIPLICRFLYKSNNDALIFAASKSIGAHLVKLEEEGKVKRKAVHMPKIVQGKVGDSEDQEGWEWVGVTQAE
ncbi:beta-lactamase-like protein [Kockovaella imperatae]|uniref:Beta-lactamase-like protein n=1 Tax=Kockovaella imperatae TaxID=4999 RepID=A0A1Y1U7F6_9TREE|nr:beta-lactamase-like protein [Kockovaella imperatae]ORX33437.1 beta-lactamase-like protein [Kockovaella imperatae]